MAPKNSRNNHDDTKSEPTKEKGSGTKSRRGANSSHTRETTAASSSTATNKPAVTNVNLEVPWNTFDRQILHVYRREYKLDTPSTFNAPYNQWVLTRSGGIGLYSPSMARRRGQRRQRKELLVAAVRNHFKQLDIPENDIIVNFLHTLHQQP